MHRDEVHGLWPGADQVACRMLPIGGEDLADNAQADAVFGVLRLSLQEEDDRLADLVISVYFRQRALLVLLYPLSLPRKAKPANMATGWRFA